MEELIKNPVLLASNKNMKELTPSLAFRILEELIITPLDQILSLASCELLEELTLILAKRIGMKSESQHLLQQESIEKVMV